jgi:hypothetical protein
VKPGVLSGERCKTAGELYDEVVCQILLRAMQVGGGAIKVKCLVLLGYEKDIYC